ncbi:hypothetical protein LZ30DRAFT_692332 [Colletotrichum cereale]|nr:hypothetical protein LZ30DRAFT_692332 [Colletotrichum cereale]
MTFQGSFSEKVPNQGVRLINTKTLELKDFVDHTRVPPYAILSHTWGDEEITLQEWHDQEVRTRKNESLFKIRRYKTNTAKRGSTPTASTKPVPPTFPSPSTPNWYRGAAVCYVYMVDVPSHAIQEDNCDPDSHFRKSRWFTCGWTLQELIASTRVNFYAANWSMLGAKRDLVDALQRS